MSCQGIESGLCRFAVHGMCFQTLPGQAASVQPALHKSFVRVCLAQVCVVLECVAAEAMGVSDLDRQIDQLKRHGSGCAFRSMHLIRSLGIAVMIAAPETRSPVFAGFIRA